MGAGGQKPRQQIEEQWLAKLRQAAEQYRLAVARREELQHEASSLPLSDGGLAGRQALSAEAAAIEEYRRVLVTFSNLVLYRKLPDEGGGSRRSPQED